MRKGISECLKQLGVCISALVNLFLSKAIFKKSLVCIEVVQNMLRAKCVRSFVLVAN